MAHYFRNIMYVVVFIVIEGVSVFGAHETVTQVQCIGAWLINISMLALTYAPLGYPKTNAQVIIGRR